MTNAVAKKEETAVSTNVQNMFGQEEVLTSDLIIPRLSLMQGQSDLVKERKAFGGDFAKTLTDEVVGGIGKPVRVIPLTFSNTWFVEELVDEKFNYVRKEPMTAANQNAEWKFEEGGVPMRRIKAIELYALLEKDITADAEEMKKFKETGELPDPTKALKPVLITFKVTSYKEGKKFPNFFADAKRYGVPGFLGVFALDATAQENEKGSFWVWSVKYVGKTEKTLLPACEEWYKLITAGKVRVEEESLKKESGEAGSAEVHSGSQF